jgi:hypothetical protein
MKPNATSKGEAIAGPESDQIFLRASRLALPFTVVGSTRILSRVRKAIPISQR